MTNWAVQLALVRLAASIRRLPEGPVEQNVRSCFLQAVERLEAEGRLPPREWDVGASRQETFLWGVRQGDHTAAAVLRYIDDFGFEVRILVDGQVRETRLFPGEAGSGAARAFAVAKRAELEPGLPPTEAEREVGAAGIR